ncbi:MULTISPECIES: CbtA family protein [Methylomonas]|uniref:CbtA family protein n=2 Tax=Methylomonas TaxID=416 RepID=A0ABY7GR34_9GAMM|nr:MULTISPECIES: CbtA family protein [Methylomonas]MDX8129977.1 CbtA family protein [Methylomonas sp. OY6]WAR46967.1 CbtA family protein [Methylomonas rapida]
MADFRKLVAVSLLAGVLGGLLLSVLQHYQTLPLILAAEQFETPSAEQAHDWQPSYGWQRNGFTWLFNSLTGFGFALLISAAMYWRDQRGYLYGLGWGLAGYWVFFVAPSLGLPPELPGTDSAELHSRQAWWLFTAAVTAGGLFGLFLSRQRWLQIGGVGLLVLPHIIGAPHPEVAHALAPEALQQQFVIGTAINNAVFWLALGALSGMALRKVTFS